jgi:hypothetical protein
MTTHTDVILARHLRAGDVIPGLGMRVEAVATAGAVDAGKVYVWPDDASHAVTYGLDEPVTIAKRPAKAEVDAFHERHEARDWREDR